MEKNGIMEVYDLLFNPVCDLYNRNGTSPLNPTVSYKINEIFKLNFELPVENPNSKEVEHGVLIYYQHEFYEVVQKTKMMSANGKYSWSIECMHYSKTLQSKMVVEETLAPLLPEDGLRAILYDGETPKYGWQIGAIIAPEVYRTIETKEQSLFQTITELAELYDCYVVFESGFRDGFSGAVHLVNLYNKDLYNPANPLQLTALNTKNIQVARDISELTTRLYAFGGTNPVTGEDIDLITETGGYTYIENYDYYTNRGYTMAEIEANPAIFRKEYVWRDSNYVDAPTLYNGAVKKLEELSQPKVSVSLTYLDENAADNLFLGKSVEFSDNVIDEYFVQMIVGYSISYDKPYEVVLETANFVDRKKEIPMLFKNLNKSSYAVNNDGTIRVKAVEQVIQTTSLFADKVTTGTLKSQNNYSWLNLNDGTFSFGNGALSWNDDTLEVLGKMNTPKIFSSGREFNTSYTYDIKFYEDGILSGVISPSFGVVGDFSTRVLDIMCSHEASILGFGIRDADNTVNRKYIINNSSDFAGQTQRHIFYDDMKINGDVTCTSVISNYLVVAPYFVHSESNKVVIGGTSSDIYLGASELPLSIFATTLRPSADNAISLGQSGRRWTAVWAVNGTIQTSGLKDKENIKPVISKDIANIKTITNRNSIATANEATAIVDNIKTVAANTNTATANDKVSNDEVYEEDFIDLLDLIAAKECTYNYKVNKDKKDKTISQSAIQLGVIADEISDHKAYKYIGIKEELEDGTINHGLQPLPIAMLAIQGYKKLRDELKELKEKKNYYLKY
jgi:hypothetical protein